MGFMYTATLLIGMKNCSSVQPVVGVERVVLYREKAAGMYSSLAYAVSQASNFLLVFIYALPYMFIIYLYVYFF